MMVDDRKNHRIESAYPQSYSDGGDPFKAYQSKLQNKMKTGFKAENVASIYEPLHEKTNILRMQKQRSRSASQ